MNCPKGSIFDLILDVRKNSKTYGKLFSIELNERNKWSIVIPPGVAHGYQTLKKNSLVYYFTSSYYEKNMTMVLTH